MKRKECRKKAGFTGRLRPGRPRFAGTRISFFLHIFRRLRLFVLLTTLLLAPLLSACGDSSWRSLKRRGVLRVVTAADADLHGLQRGVSPRDTELAMLEAFARENGLRLETLRAKRFADMAAMLKDGRADVIANNFAVTPEREKDFLFTCPVFRVRELVVVPKTMFAIPESPRIAILRGSAYERHVPELKKLRPDARIDFVDGDPEDILVLVGEGIYDMTLIDSNLLTSYRRYRDDVKILDATSAPEGRPTAWAVRKSAKRLKRKLNAFIERNRSEFASAHHVGDLPDIRKRRILRVITQDSPVNYYFDLDELQGFEYALAKRFAERIGVGLVMITPTEKENPLNLLTSGAGDLIASGAAYTQALASRKDVACSVSYATTRDVFVQAAGKPVPQTFEGRSVRIHRDSPYYETLLGLQGKLRFRIEFAPPTLETAEIMQNVAQGTDDLTMSNDLQVSNAILRGGVEAQALAVAESRPKDCVWVVRAENPLLKAAVDDFFREECKSADFQILFRTFFGDPAWRAQPAAAAQPFLSDDEFYSVANAEEADAAPVGARPAPKAETQKKPAREIADAASQTQKKTAAPPRVLSRFDAVIKTHARKNGFDWRLIAALICQESRFRPRAVARDGGRGLMQLMPGTMREMNCADPFNPQENIRAGVEYLEKQRAKLPDSIRGEERICFALASYNCGYGHVLDARRIARGMKLDPDKWFGNVEKAMNLLKIRRYYSRTRYGYCQSDITIRYVREIMSRWREYEKEYPAD